jgi:hypothetical protein
LVQFSTRTSNKYKILAQTKREGKQLSKEKNYERKENEQTEPTEQPKQPEEQDERLRREMQEYES